MAMLERIKATSALQLLLAAASKSVIEDKVPRVSGKCPDSFRAAKYFRRI
jgi:hypothetical protein